LFTVKNIINQSFDRTGIYPNLGNPLPGEMAKMGLDLLSGIVSSMNTRNLLLWSQHKLKFTANTEEIELDANEIEVKIASIPAVYCNSKKQALEDVPFQIFDSYSDSDFVYNARQVSADKWLLQIKRCSVNEELTVIYNEALECEMNTEYYAPDEYQELLILALMSKLLIVYVRSDEAMKEQVDRELNQIVDNIRSKQSNLKLIMNNRHSKSTWSSFVSGDFL